MVAAMRGGMSRSEKNRWQKRSAQKIDRILTDILDAYEERGGIEMLRSMDDTTFMAFMLKVVEPYMREKSKGMAKQQESVPVYELAPSDTSASEGAAELKELYEQVKARMQADSAVKEEGGEGDVEGDVEEERDEDDAPVD